MAIMTCYNPDGQENGGLNPCDPKASVSACCRSGDVCLSSGYCFSPGLSALVRRGCTDNTFNSTKCPQKCRTGPFLDFADVIMTPCNTVYTFCCGNDEAGRECCNAGNGTFRIESGAAEQSTASAVSASTVFSTSTATISAAAVSATTASGDVETQKKMVIGLGAGLGALAIIAAALVYWLMSKKVKAKQSIIDIQSKGISLNNRGA